MAQASTWTPANVVTVGRIALVPFVVLALVFAIACSTTPEPPPSAPPAPSRSDWQLTRETALRMMLDGRYQEADSALRAFERRAVSSENTDSGALAESRFRPWGSGQ